MADDLHAEVLTLALAAIDEQRMGEDYGAAVTFGAVPVQAAQGTRLVPLWQILITARNPLLGEGPLWHMVPLGSSVRPTEADVKAVVADGLRQLRSLAASKLATSNGKQPVPAGGTR